MYLWEKDTLSTEERNRVKKSLVTLDYEALTALGLRYALGFDGYFQNKDYAIKLFNMCMRAKYAQSYYVYALLLINPKFNNPIDEHKYVAFLKRSMNLGFDKAISKIGEAYLEGVGVKESYREAEYYLVKARCKESAEPLHKLARIYREQGYFDKAKDLESISEKYKYIE
jgi:TPR repeat protein